MNDPVEEIAALYRAWGDDPYDEQVSQLDHALQCAALAQADGADDALITAALLHDIGHLFEIRRSARPDHARDLRHEHVGAEHLRTTFDDDVVLPIELHVEAKRYLSATDADYAAALSDGSARSLVVQGGPFTAAECEAFLSRPGAHSAIRLRRWDDAGKVVGLDVHDLEHWLPIVRRAATN